MELILTLSKDKDGIHLVDELSGVGMHWHSRADVAVWLKQRDGEEWEQAFRAAAREIAARIPNLDEPLAKKDFTFTPSKAETTWP